MERQDQLRWCTQCSNRKFDRGRGIVCGLTNEYANFAYQCEQFVQDPKAQRELEKKMEVRREKEIRDETLGLVDLGIKNGVTAGIVVIVLSVVGLFAGLFFFQRLFILTLVGIVAGILAIVFGSKRQREEMEKRMRQ